MDSKSMFTALRRKVRELDGGMPVYDMKTLERQLDETLSTERLIAVLSAAFGLPALADWRWQGRERTQARHEWRHEFRQFREEMRRAFR